jgi:hypothetical protein
MAFMGNDDGFRGETDAPLTDEQLDAVQHTPAAGAGEAMAPDGELLDQVGGRMCVECGERLPPGTEEHCGRATDELLRCLFCPSVGGYWRSGDACLAAAHETLAESQRRVEELERQWVQLEEREAACCPEDLPFDQYIHFLEQRIGRDAPLRDFLAAHYSPLRDDLQPWALAAIATERTAREAAERERDEARGDFEDAARRVREAQAGRVEAERELDRLRDAIQATLLVAHISSWLPPSRCEKLFARLMEEVEWTPEKATERLHASLADGTDEHAHEEGSDGK